MDLDQLPYIAPPGDEGLDMSHAGGEYEVFEGLAHEVAGISGCRYVDPRTHSDRIENETNHWNIQMDLLVEAYLDYCYRDSGDGVPHHGMPPSPSDDDGQPRRRSSLRSQPHHQYPNETLIHHGYLGCAPLYPTVAIFAAHSCCIPPDTRVCPTFSFQAQFRQIPYRPYLTTQLLGAFNVYLQILQRIDQRLCTALKRDTPNWRLLNACPACFYKLEDEPDLDFDWLVTMDGNNSLKRWDSMIYGTNAQVDSRKVRSDFWIDPNTVDKFNSEVRAHAAMPNQGDNALVDNTAVETNPAPFSCADWWKNAGPEMQKKMFSVFDESGIFITACRHRFVLLACDMIRSGEL
ncbi:hypothetical protein EV702DRAFT_1180151 [Suillus placidus]|uniref:CxC1-like cysteine cluster associated with KDZ transposases domain-containing protein n=1 Tax=Suillus placidus TaxID=48579 RepID=A0A9P6ZSX0_9AGAM|nr:hypothetical protein EV702DRAFT_1180151 [Suillus placidus]